MRCRTGRFGRARPEAGAPFSAGRVGAQVVARTLTPRRTRPAGRARPATRNPATTAHGGASAAERPAPPAWRAPDPAGRCAPVHPGRQQLTHPRGVVDRPGDDRQPRGMGLRQQLGRHQRDPRRHGDRPEVESQRHDVAGREVLAHGEGGRDLVADPPDQQHATQLGALGTRLVKNLDVEAAKAASLDRSVGPHLADDSLHDVGGIPLRFGVPGALDLDVEPDVGGGEQLEQSQRAAQCRHSFTRLAAKGLHRVGWRFPGLAQVDAAKLGQQELGDGDGLGR